MNQELPPILSIVGRKNSGKTTLLVALAAELRRRGYRLASLKHGHHAFEIDRPGTDSWRHVHEGEVEAVTLVASGRLALISRTDGDPDPRELIRRFYAGLGYDLVLVEGYKHGPFPKLEIHRSAVHDRPIFDPETPSSAGFLALITDRPDPDLSCPTILLDPAGSHVSEVADLVERSFLRSR